VGVGKVWPKGVGVSGKVCPGHRFKLRKNKGFRIKVGSGGDAGYIPSRFRVNIFYTWHLVLRHARPGVRVGFDNETQGTT
jgi:hypothetical protein